MKSPVSYPEVTLPNGAVYRIRFGMKAVRKLKEWGLLGTEAAQPSNDIDVNWKLIAGNIAAGAHTDKEGRLIYAELTPQMVIDAYDDDPDPSDIAELGAAIRQAETFLTPSGGASSQSEAAQTENPGS